MIEIAFAASEATAHKVASMLRTWRMTVFYDTNRRMYYVHVTTMREMNQVASALAFYGLIEPMNP